MSSLPETVFPEGFLSVHEIVIVSQRGKWGELVGTEPWADSGDLERILLDGHPWSSS